MLTGVNLCEQSRETASAQGGTGDCWTLGSTGSAPGSVRIKSAVLTYVDQESEFMFSSIRKLLTKAEDEYFSSRAAIMKRFHNVNGTFLLCVNLYGHDVRSFLKSMI